VQQARIGQPFDLDDIRRSFQTDGSAAGRPVPPAATAHRRWRSDQVLLAGLKKLIGSKSEGQRLYLEAIANNDIVISIGPAGTGKTYLAVAAAVDALRKNRVKRIILARPAVEAGENLGFLPGDLQEKVDPYLRPLYDALEDIMPADWVRRAIEARTIEIAPLAYMRGRTLADAFVILDEAQNATSAQMKMFLTRLGLNSRVVITGDKTQIDLPRRDDSGLLEVERILRGIDGIEFVYLDEVDVVRHRLVKDIIKAYAVADEERQEELRGDNVPGRRAAARAERGPDTCGRTPSCITASGRLLLGLVFLLQVLFPVAPVPNFPELERGMVPQEDVIADVGFTIPKSDAELAQEREEAAPVAPVFRYDPTARTPCWSGPPLHRAPRQRRPEGEQRGGAPARIRTC
jgi:phosphate starvation-inducible protein PhoH and related proteins